MTGAPYAPAVLVAGYDGSAAAVRWAALWMEEDALADADVELRVEDAAPADVPR
jgi:hypothetical protein